MKLYKYRSPSSLEHILDILLNNRLYCTPYNELNDPFEGVFRSVQKMGFGDSKFGSGIFGTAELKTSLSIPDLSVSKKIRVCSLSASKADIMLWSHYAGGHSGIAIEVQLGDNNGQLHKVRYVEQLKEINPSFETPDSTEILKLKSTHWEYEEEYRIISNEEHYDISGKITAIYLGPRVSEVIQKTIIRSVDASIPVFSTKLDGETLEVKTDKKLN
jgi:hypothetical protein